MRAGKMVADTLRNRRADALWAAVQYGLNDFQAGPAPPISRQSRTLEYRIGSLAAMRGATEAFLRQAPEFPFTLSLNYFLAGLDRWYYGGHAMTRLGRNGVQLVRVTGPDDVWAIVRTFLLDREELDSAYTVEDAYEVPTAVRFVCHSPVYDQNYGDRQSNLMANTFDQNEGTKGSCLWNAIRAQHPSGARPDFSKVTDDEFRRQTGCSPKGVTLSQLDQIEGMFVHRNRNGIESRLSFAVLDSRFNLIRLPPRPAADKHTSAVTYLVAGDGHFYFPKLKRAAAIAVQRDLSFIQATAAFLAPDLKALQKAYKKSQAKLGRVQDDTFQFRDGRAHTDGLMKWLERVVTCEVAACAERVQWATDYATTEEGKRLNDLVSYEGAWECFRLHQHLLPDRVGFNQAVTDYARGTQALEPVVHQERRGDKGALIWAPGPGTVSNARPTRIKALGLERKCKELGIDPKDSQAVRNNRTQIASMPTAFEPVDAPSMANVAVFDLETGSTMDAPGRFLTYASGLQSADGYREFIAEQPEDLDGRLVWQTVQECERLAEEHDKFYVYSYNGSRFDNVAVMYEALARSDSIPITDALISNGKIIKFTYGKLVFMDLCLITMDSLKRASMAYGIAASKGDLPHAYYQNCRDKHDLIRRIHKTVERRVLEPYMDWFGDLSPQDMQVRKVGRSYDEWVGMQPCRQRFLATQDEQVDMFGEMKEYLNKDVECLWQLVEKVGEGLAKVGCDIRQYCTVGSCAVRLWKQTLDRPITKLDEQSANRWAHVNRGGFCGPMGVLDYICMAGQAIYGFDITSLYPSCLRNPTYTNEAGETVQPIGPWYQGFPNPDASAWEVHDYGGVEMDDTHRGELAGRLGLVRITFDQRGCRWPVLLKKMEHAAMQTLAMVQEGQEWFCIPQILHAYDNGVKVSLGECQYTTESHEPFSSYVGHFELLKNGADAVALDVKSFNKLRHTTAEERTAKLQQAQVLLESSDIDAREKGRAAVRADIGYNRCCHLSDAERAEISTKAGYDRTIAKLFANSLPGRLNIEIARKQTVLTRSGDDVANVIFNPDFYRGARVENLECGGRELSRLSFIEGDYDTHAAHFDAAPHLSAYMLCYSKVLMAQHHLKIVDLGGTPLYGDTDSVKAAMTKEQSAAYRAWACPPEKTFGGMELECTAERLLTAGPKKYLTVEADEDGGHTYEFRANGIPARHNVDRDILETFESVVHDRETRDVGYFSIKAESNFSLTHTTGATKRLRFIMLKGAVEETERGPAVRPWKNEAEFVTYAQSLTTQIVPTTKSLVQSVRDYVDATPPLDMSVAGVKRKLAAGGDRLATQQRFRAFNMALQDTVHRVYLLASDVGETYFGYSVDVCRRLRQHNGGLSGGARHTTNSKAPGTWRVVAQARGFLNKTEALRFEARCNIQERDGVASACDIMGRVFAQKTWAHIALVEGPQQDGVEQIADYLDAEEQERQERLAEEHKAVGAERVAKRAARNESAAEKRRATIAAKRLKLAAEPVEEVAVEPVEPVEPVAAEPVAVEPVAAEPVALSVGGDHAARLDRLRARVQAALAADESRDCPRTQMAYAKLFLQGTARNGYDSVAPPVEARRLTKAERAVKAAAAAARKRARVEYEEGRATEEVVY
jgi:predicted GIY-YIG superfamily endonuclease